MAARDLAAGRVDKASQGNLDVVAYSHLSLVLSCDFEASTLSGTATWTVEQTKLASEVVLDTSSGLVVTSASVCGAPVDFSLRAEKSPFGRACVVPVPMHLREVGRELKVALQYRTAPESSALQWLPPAQTAGKEHPYVFSQCEAIHARALLPCPDAPAVKFTYDAQVEVPDWATALLSAVSTGAPTAAGDRRVFGFEQTVPIPSYLVAIAVGELAAVTVGPRSQVWAEPCVVEKAAWEFGETEKFLATAEQLLEQAYVWKRYDILCLPPSFPYGGMENPCLTFVTPTLLAGDRSLADVVCHEVSHSWTGNLVTNHTWEHFWLNEGWTRWLESRILARLQGEEFMDFSIAQSLSHLADDVANFGPRNPLTCLVPQLDGIDPDDSFGAVPYEKGLALLNYLTEVVGSRTAFEGFARAYISAFKYRTLTSADFRDFFLGWCEQREIDASAVDWEAWFHTPGMPPALAAYEDTMGARAVSLAKRWLAEGSAQDPSFSSDDTEGWPSKLRIAFLDTLVTRCLEPEGPLMSAAAIARLDEVYGLTAMRNSEVRLRWGRLCIRHRAAFIVPHVIDFLKEQGRMKFVRPLYRDLGAWPEQRALAVETFQASRAFYHPIAAKMIAVDLKLASEPKPGAEAEDEAKPEAAKPEAGPSAVKRAAEPAPEAKAAKAAKAAPTGGKKVSPYIAFCKVKRPEIVAANPAMSFGEVGKALGAAWKALSAEEKAAFKSAE